MHTRSRWCLWSSYARPLLRQLFRHAKSIVQQKKHRSRKYSCIRFHRVPPPPRGWWCEAVRFLRAPVTGLGNLRRFGYHASKRMAGAPCWGYAAMMLVRRRLRRSQLGRGVRAADIDGFAGHRGGWRSVRLTIASNNSGPGVTTLEKLAEAYLPRSRRKRRQTGLTNWLLADARHTPRPVHRTSSQSCPRHLQNRHRGC